MLATKSVELASKTVQIHQTYIENQYGMLTCTKRYPMTHKMSVQMSRNRHIELLIPVVPHVSCEYSLKSIYKQHKYIRPINTTNLVYLDAPNPPYDIQKVCLDVTKSLFCTFLPGSTPYLLGSLSNTRLQTAPVMQASIDSRPGMLNCT